MGSQDLGPARARSSASCRPKRSACRSKAVTVNIGDNKYPPGGASGGSTTVGGVSSSTRVRRSYQASNELFAKVAPSLGAQPDQLEAFEGKIRVDRESVRRVIPWKQACAKLGATPITATGKRNSGR